MRRGHFKVSVEIMSDSNWLDVEKELSKVFTLEAKETKPFGIVEFHGTSPLFDESIEGSSPQYDCVFKTVFNKPKFCEFKKVS